MTMIFGALALAAIVTLFTVRNLKSAQSLVGGAEHFGGGEKRLVVIHAQWCGHCTELLKDGGVWDGVKAKLPGVSVEELDEASDPETIQQLNVTSFPSICVLDGNKSVAHFDGDRTVDSIVEFAMQHIQ